MSNEIIYLIIIFVFGTILGIYQACRNVKASQDFLEKFDNVKKSAKTKQDIINGLGNPSSISYNSDGNRVLTWKVENQYHTFSECSITIDSNDNIL